MIEIILKAEDQASQVFKQNEQNIKRFGDAAKQANNTAKRSSDEVIKGIYPIHKELEKVTDDYMQVASKGSNAFNKLSQKEQEAVVKFEKLDDEAKSTMMALREMGESFDIKNIGNAVTQFNQLDSSTKTWSGSLDYAKSKLSLLGTNTDSLRGKIQVAGTAVTTYLGTKWDGIKQKVSGVAQEIRGRIGSAIDTVKAKLGGVGGGFNKLKTGAESAGQGMGMLRQAASMTVGMIGYDLLNSITQSARESINASANFQAFGKRMKMSATEISNFSEKVDGMQSSFRKVDMKAVGAAALEMGVKLKLPKNSMEELTKTTAVMSSAFVKEGRTQTDALLAVSDAMDGQFRRLQEIGISQDMLKNNGWDGDLQNKTGLLQAMNKTLDEMGFTTTAQQINTLDDAYAAITVSGGQLLAGVLIPMTPVITGVADALFNAIQFVKDNGWAQGAVLIASLAVGFSLLAGALSVAAAAEGGMMALMPGFITSLYGAASGFMAISVAGAPLWAIVAVVAAITFAVYELGISFGWWTDVGSMIDAITSNIGRLWNAFVNHPDVRAIVQAIGGTWNWLLDVTKPVVDWLKGIWDEMFPESAKGKVDGTRIIIDAIGQAFTILTIHIRSVYSILQLLYPYMLQFYQGALVPLGNFLVTVFTPVWQLIQSILAQISPLVLSVSNAFTQFANGQMSLPALIQNVMFNLWNIYTTILNNIVNAVISWAGKIVARGVNAASRFVSGIVNWIANLPGRISTYLYNVVNRIISAGASWVSNGVSAASRMVSGVINNVSQLPGKVYNEFMNIGSRIMQAGSDLVNKAKNIGKNIVDGLLGAMGIHSPGTIQTSVVNEFVNMIGRVADKVKSAKDTAKSMGEAIVEGFGNPSLETNTENMLPNEDALKTSIGVQAELSHQVSDAPNPTVAMDTSGVTAGNSDVIGSYDNLAAMTGSALQGMVDRDKLAYDTIRMNDANTLSQMTTNLSQKMGQMSSNVSTNMNNIVAKNKTSMNNVNTTTKSNLNSIVSKTKSANTQMIKSWGVMKDGIVSAANKIKSDSTTHFNKLSETIGSFYGKLKNPSRWGAGSPITKTHNRSSGNSFNRITNAIRNAQLPKYLSLGQIKANPNILAGNFGDYITKDKKTNMFNVGDLLHYGAIQLLGRGAGAYSNIPSPNVKLIKDTSNEWDMKGPLVGKFQTNHGFKVKEFLTGIPKISFDVFRSIAEDVFGQTNYEFYYDDDHHGNWVNAFNAGSMNCKHGAEALIALAQTMGLSGSMVHGHWTDSSGTYGHYFANIAGHKMDVTGWQQRRTWTPSASAGPAPKSYGFKDLIETLKKIFEDDPNTPGAPSNTSTEDNIMKGEFTIVHEFKDLPEGITAEEVAKLVEESTTNDNFIKKLAQNPLFQKWDLKTKGLIEAKNNRARGV